MKVAVLFSGGKDSTFAVWLTQHQGWNVATLLTVRPSTTESLMFHHPNVEWTRLQAQAMDVPHDLIEVRRNTELDDLGKELDRLKVDEGISGVVSGAVASDYQKTRFDDMCESIGLKSFAPLWHKDPKLLVEDLKSAGYRIIITAVAAKGMDESWLGRELSEGEWSRLERLSKTHGINLAGEGGEYESFVLDAPHFRESIRIVKSRMEWEGDSGRLVIEKASLGDKLSHS
ncbi:MAG TPA: diphthine--ammonia ligase [Candidatus Dormibacteraeota bacterium]|nr:diphthine--ammonia ligase [Candidatus Dormibacteraeota bacterium]